MRGNVRQTSIGNDGASMKRWVRRGVIIGLLGLAVCPVTVDAQEADQTRLRLNLEPVLPSSSEPTQEPPAWVAERRACEGCPPRSVGRALFQTTMINVFYEMANLIRGQATAKITPKTWWDNMEQGWVWDLDDFTVNQIGHPYQGNNYFTSGRANGLSFYESAALTAFGSGTWEYFGETNFPSVNDFVNTTLGGIALGEMFHRTAWLVRDTRATGRGRLWREIGATVLDPVTGYNRFRRGDASRITDKPADMVPSTLAGFTSAGVLWRGSETRAVDATGQPFLEMDLLYGDPRTGYSRTPYDAFSVRLRFGGGSAFSEARVRGRLLGQPLGSGKRQFSVLQSYDYQSNDAYATGAQSFEAAYGVTHALSSRTDVWFFGWGGLTASPSARRNLKSQAASRGYRRGRVSTTTAPERRLARARASHAIAARSRFSSTKVVICTRWMASERTTSCSAAVWTCCCRCEAPWVSVCPASISFVRASTRTKIVRSWNIAIPSSARILRGASSDPTSLRNTALRCARRLARANRGRRAVSADGTTDTGAG
jgi:hypothetical protein